MAPHHDGWSPGGKSFPPRRSFSSAPERHLTCADSGVRVHLSGAIMPIRSAGPPASASITCLGPRRPEPATAFRRRLVRLHRRCGSFARPAAPLSRLILSGRLSVTDGYGLGRQREAAASEADRLPVSAASGQARAALGCGGWVCACALVWRHVPGGYGVGPGAPPTRVRTGGRSPLLRSVRDIDDHTEAPAAQESPFETIAPCAC
jgi:hypothetical protein